MKRVMIVGGPGSGKSTLARIMGARTDLPVHHMDRIHWTPGWVERNQADRCAMVRDVIAQDTWIFEGFHRRTDTERAARADTMVWLDLPVLLRFYRVIWRTFRDRGRVRPDMADNCAEGFNEGTFAFWLWIWTSRKGMAQRIAAMIDQHPDLRVHHLKSRSQVADFIDSLPANSGGSQ